MTRCGSCTKRRILVATLRKENGVLGHLLKRKGYEMFSITDIINLAVRIEENAEKIFRDAATKVANPALVPLLHWLADEEVKHVEWFSELNQKVKKTIDDPELENMGKAILQDMLGDQTFSLKDVDFGKLDQIEPLLRRAIEFEDDTILFYEMISSFVEDKETLDHLNAIIQEERSHVQLLEEFLDSGAVEMD
jgi:rubrerythrin